MVDGLASPGIENNSVKVDRLARGDLQLTVRAALSIASVPHVYDAPHPRFYEGAILFVDEYLRRRGCAIFSV